MSAIVIGLGEVGGPILSLIQKTESELDWWYIDANLGCGNKDGLIQSGKSKPEDLLSSLNMTCRKRPLFMHVCFPEQPQFVQKVLNYIRLYEPDHVIIHSTTTPGVCSTIQNLIEPKMPNLIIYSSPVRGNIRDGMTEGLLGYWKYLAPARWNIVDREAVDYLESDKPRIEEAVRHLKSLGMSVRAHNCATDLEWAKSLDLGFYGVALAYYQLLERIVDEHDVDYKIVKEFIETTPEQSQGKAKRILFYGGYIGGHCVVPALERLAAFEKGLNVPPGESLLRAALESNQLRLIELVNHKPSHHPD